MAEVLSKQPRPQGPRLAIVTNAGGPGVLAADSVIAAGGQLAQLSPPSMNALNEILPAHWSHNNPIDILGDALPERYAKVLEIAARDPEIDGLLAVLCPQGMSQSHADRGEAGALCEEHWQAGDCELDGRSGIAAGIEILNQAGIPTFPYPRHGRTRFRVHVALQLQPARAV